MSMQKIDLIIERTDLNKLEIVQKVYVDYLKNNASNFELIVRRLVKWECKSELEYTQKQKELIGRVGHEYFDYIQQTILAIARKNYSAEDFYNKLYDTLFESEIFPESDEERGVVLLFLTSQMKGIPYYKADNLLEMGEEEFGQIIDKLEDKLDKACFMADERFRTKTEEASQLCDIAESIKDERERKVFWAVVIDEIRRMEREEKSKEK